MALSNIKLFEKIFFKFIKFYYIFYFLHFCNAIATKKTFVLCNYSQICFSNTHNVIFLKYLISTIFLISFQYIKPGKLFTLLFFEKLMN